MTKRQYKDNSPATNDAGQVKCPLCGHLMIPMASGKGLRCGTPGNRWQRGRWSICQGIVWLKSGGQSHWNKKKIDRPSDWPNYPEPTKEQLAILKFTAQTTKERGNVSCCINAGPGSAKTNTMVRAMRAVCGRVSNVNDFALLAFNANARDNLLKEIPGFVTNINTINQFGGRAQGYRYQDYKKSKIRDIYKALVSDERDPHNFGACAAFIDRMRDSCVYFSSSSDPRWIDAITDVVIKYPSLGKKYKGSEKFYNEFIPLLFIQAHQQFRTIDLTEQWSRPVTDAIARLDWTPEKPFIDLVKAIQVPRWKGLIIDESQDLSLGQIAFLLASIGTSGECYFVGDDCRGDEGEQGYKAGQGIYGWRGAFKGSMVKMAETLELLQSAPVKELELSITFRCPPEHVTAFRSLHTTLSSFKSEGSGWVRQLGYDEALELVCQDSETDTLWITRTNRKALTPLLDLLRLRKKVSLRGRDQGLLAQVEGVLYKVAGYRNERSGDYKVSFKVAYQNLEKLISELNGDAGDADPDSFESFIFDLFDAIQNEPAILKEANLDGLSVGNVYRFVEYFLNSDAPIVISTVYRCKGDQATNVIVDDCEQLNNAWNGDEVESAACRLVAVSRSKCGLVLLGKLGGVVVPK